jgi:hypothetical protein
MLLWTHAGSVAQLVMLVHHADATREYAYGPAGGLPDTHVGTFPDALLTQATQGGWVVISMQRDWKRISSSTSNRAGRYRAGFLNIKAVMTNGQSGGTILFRRSVLDADLNRQRGGLPPLGGLPPPPLGGLPPPPLGGLPPPLFGGLPPPLFGGLPPLLGGLPPLCGGGRYPGGR